MTKSTDLAVSCPAAIAAGKVCAHAVTVAELRSFGIHAARALPHYREPGIELGKAIHEAWGKGFVRMCTLDPASTGRPWLADKTIPDHVAETLAWVKANLRERDRK